MKKLSRLLTICILISLLCGQLARFQLTPRVAFYPHDILIVIFILLNIPVFLQAWRALPRRCLVGVALMLVWSAISFTFNHAWSLVPLLYLARLLTYVTFGLVLAQTQLWTPREYVFLLTAFFGSLAFLGLAQYLLFPDARFLENLGWDDHYYRVLGTWFDPVFTALAYLFGWLFFIAHRQEFVRSPSKKVALTLIMILLTVSLIFTYSRSVYLAFAACLIAFLPSVKTNDLRTRLREYRYAYFFLACLLSALCFVAFVVLARLIPSDSTNLLRTNSLQIRAATLLTYCQQLTPGQWFFGRGPFVPLPASLPPGSSVDFKLTAAFPDNFFILLISFWGLPVALVVTALIFYGLYRLYCRHVFTFYYFLALLVVAQFNQAVFQPFIVILLTFLLSDPRFVVSRPQNRPSLS